MVARRPRLSVIVCVYDMAREAPRTIVSSVTPYQRDVDADDVEVIVVDNGSPDPLRDTFDSPLPSGVTLVDAPDPRPSPVFALNWAAREVAQGDHLLFAIDGARLFSDGLLANTLAAHDVWPDALVYTLAWHLGPAPQMESVAAGYDQAAEDRLLTDAGWPDRPAALFEISVLAGSSRFGLFRAPAESNAFSISRARFEQIGGYDERFTSPGGGLCNLEMFHRHATAPGPPPVCLWSEGTFHQVHGGIATSGRVEWGELDDEHGRIVGRPFETPVFEPTFFGPLRPEVVPFLEQSIEVRRSDEHDRAEVAPPPVDEVVAQAAPDESGGRWTRRMRRLARLRPRQ